MTLNRDYSTWNSNTSNDNKIEPFRRYHFVCEGENTEGWYFDKLQDLKKELNFRTLIEIITVDKGKGNKNLSNPKSLLHFAKKAKKINFDKTRDKMVMVFDFDIYQTNDAPYQQYKDVLKEAESQNITVGVTNPSFELFLMLHDEDSLNTLIRPNEKEILNGKDGSKRFMYKFFIENAGIDPKANKEIGEFAKKVGIAIAQENNINNDITKCEGEITSNIGQIIQSIIDDNGTI